VHESLVAATRAIDALAPRDRKIVAVDGLDGAGKSTFADALAQVVDRPVLRASVDDFHNPSELRYRRGRESPLGFYLDSFDTQSLIRVLLGPFGSGDRFRRRVFDHETDMPVRAPVEDAAGDAILVIDGLFLHREELRPWWDVSIWLDVAPAVAAQRLLLRDGRPTRSRYVRGNELYFAAVRPPLHASLTLTW
jgi:uridine kinase